MDFTKLLLALNRVTKTKLVMFAIIVLIFKLDATHNYTGLYGNVKQYLSGVFYPNVNRRPFSHSSFYTELIRLTHHDNLKLAALYEFVPPADEIDYIGKKIITWYSPYGYEDIEDIKKLGADFMPIRSNPLQVDAMISGKMYVDNLLYKTEEKELSTKWRLKYFISDSITYFIHFPILDDRGKAFAFITLGFDGAPSSLKGLEHELIEVTKRIAIPLHDVIRPEEND